MRSSGKKHSSKGQYGVWSPLFSRQWMKGWGNRRHLLKTSAQRSFFQTWKKRYFVLSWDLLLFRFTTAVPTKKSDCAGFTDLKKVIMKHGKKGKRGVIIYKTASDDESDIEELRFGAEMYDEWCQRFFQGSSGWMRSVGFCLLGSVRIIIEQARELQTEKSVPNSFCKIFFGDIPMGVTPTIKDTSNPQWHHEIDMHFMCFVRSPVLRLEVYSQNAVFDNTHIGTCTFSLVDGNSLVTIPCERWFKVTDAHHCEYDTSGLVKVRIESIDDSSSMKVPQRNKLLYSGKPGKSHYKHTGRTAQEVVEEMYGKRVWLQMDETYLTENTSAKASVDLEERVVASFPSNECSAFETPTHLMLTSTRMVLLLDRVGPNRGCLTSTQPSLAATRPEIFSVPIGAIESWRCSLEESKVGAVLSVTFKLNGCRHATIELGPVDEYIGERDELAEAMDQLTKTSLEKADGPSRSSICSSSFRRLASTTSRLRFDSMALDLNRNSAKMKKMKSTPSKGEQSTSKRGAAGEKLIRHEVFAMLRQWLVSLAHRRALLTTSHVASLQERSYYDVLNVVRDEVRHGAKQKVIEALRNRSEELRHMAEACDASTTRRRWKLWKWTYSAKREFRRQGVGRSSCRWKVSELNKSYEFSPTYPKVIVTLKGRNRSDPSEERTVEELLRLSARGRSKARVIGLTWLHPHTQAPLLRCAQPLVGGTFKVNQEDEKVMMAIQAATPGNKPLLIADCRSYLAASANMARGGGFENVNRLHNKVEIDFFDIGNIHVVRKSLQKVFEATAGRMDPTEKDSNGGYLTEISQSGWLNILSDILCGAVKVVESLESGVAVICHCSDGWDRTSQICALAEIMLDPFYRTIEGFATLVEKDWCSFGHKFHDRCMSLGKEWSPAFVQFLDCVYQLHCQFPRQFEFNIELLVLAAECALSGSHGNFLYNNEKDRDESLVETCSNNMWDFVFAHRNRFLNPLFDHANLPHDSLSAETNVIHPEFCVRHLRLCKPLLIRMPAFRNGSVTLDINDVLRNLLFCSTGAQLADAMGLSVTPHGLVMTNDGAASSSPVLASGSSKRAGHRRANSAVSENKQTSIGEGWYMYHDKLTGSPYFYNKKTKTRRSSWPEELGMPPKELFPPPPPGSFGEESHTGKHADNGEYFPPPTSEPSTAPKDRDDAASKRPISRPDLRLNLSEVSAWSTRRSSQDDDGVVTSMLSMKRDKEGRIGIKFDDHLNIIEASAWAQSFGMRSGQQIIECEGQSVKTKAELVRAIPGKNMFSLCVRHPKGGAPSTNAQRKSLRGMSPSELTRYLDAIGVPSRVVKNFAAEDMTGDDFLVMERSDFECLGLTEMMHRQIIEGRLNLSAGAATDTHTPRRHSQAILHALSSSAKRRQHSRGGSLANEAQYFNASSSSSSSSSNGTRGG